VPGDRIEIKENKVLIYNAEHQDGMALAEPYLSPDTPTVVRSGGQDAFTLAPEEYLVLGDNRSYSFDSRDWGVLRADEVIGLVRLRLWPLKGAMVFAAPQY
jgi:signal peptidase I